jgi:hypothetical protein
MSLFACSLRKVDFRHVTTTYISVTTLWPRQCRIFNPSWSRFCFSSQGHGAPAATFLRAPLKHWSPRGEHILVPFPRSAGSYSYNLNCSCPGRYPFPGTNYGDPWTPCLGKQFLFFPGYLSLRILCKYSLFAAWLLAGSQPVRCAKLLISKPRSIISNIEWYDAKYLTQNPYVVNDVWWFQFPGRPATTQ